MDEYERLEQISKEYVEILDSSFKGIFSSSGGYSGASFHAALSLRNKSYRNSDYYYNLNQNKRFIHFTSLPNLFSILNERAIRLYSLTNSNDEMEYAHAAQILGLHDNWQKNSKNNSFTFSFCHPSELNNEHLWKIYAKKGTGCCIEFEIQNELDTWINFHLSEVKYQQTDNFSKFKKSMDALKEKYPYADFQSELGRLIIFHKSAKWKKEKELRLSTYMGDWEGNNDRRNKDIPTEMRISRKKDVRYIDYVKLPIATKEGTTESENFFSKNPKIRITAIYLGENIPFSSLAKGEFRVKLGGLIQNKIGQFHAPKYIQVHLHQEWNRSSNY